MNTEENRKAEIEYHRCHIQCLGYLAIPMTFVSGKTRNTTHNPSFISIKLQLT